MRVWGEGNECNRLISSIIPAFRYTALHMVTIFDSDSPLSDQDMLEVRQYAKERIGLWRKRSIYSTVALLLSCASVYPFLKGHPLHEHWESFGIYLVLLSMALLAAFVSCTGFFYSAWQALSDIPTDLSRRCPLGSRSAGCCWRYHSLSTAPSSSRSQKA